MRSEIRLREGRTKPIDILSGQINPSDDFDIEIDEPYMVFKVHLIFHILESVFFFQISGYLYITLYCLSCFPLVGSFIEIMEKVQGVNYSIHVDLNTCRYEIKERMICQILYLSGAQLFIEKRGKKSHFMAF